jgi:hypothetical protein
LTTGKPSKTIDQVFAEFLAEQEARLSEKTFWEYESIIDLLRSYLERYGPDADDEQYDETNGAGATYCGIYGPDEIPGSVSEFLHYFMPRKVMASELADLLAGWADENAPEHFSQCIEDHFTVVRIEPGKLWLEPLTSLDSAIGPVPVPGEVSENCQVGWDISGSLAKTRRGWRWLEIWNVSP